jgi:hypothetical protein
MTPEDDGFGDHLGAALRELDPPPDVPREELWARVQAQRARRTGSALPLRRRVPVPRWLRWGAALAAMLVVGIGLGRLSSQLLPAGGQAGRVAPPDPELRDDVAASAPYRFAATLHLQRTEALLASLAVDAPATGAAELSGWARDLLTDTRLLLASPAANDPALMRLLEDLEIVLAQIAAIPAARAQEEVELIQDGINQSGVLLRLRATTRSRTIAGT